ncbi:MAG: T9SS type A sorting domain-containing protein [Bacteroidetes bacterium]|nr:T9SS type A sorting domain-containing protein [Bacteroidota bacterium]
MKNQFKFLLVAFSLLSITISAQQNVVVVSRCGGTDTVTIPSIVDNDADGMDDALEQQLLNYFMPTVIQFDDESCPGPALNGTGDSNLIVCHIYPLPQQYSFSSSLDSVLTHPTAIVPKKGLAIGMIWYAPLIKVNTALLYGKDCGAAGHTADVEGFNFSLKYIGADTVAGWMYDTDMQHWMGGTIQTVSHASTLCEHVETLPYKSALVPSGVDTVYASPDKHGNYLSIGACGSSFICNPGCGGIPSKKNVQNINIGEPNASLVSDLGNIYAAYSGNDPWGNSNFLSANSGNAGTIKAKMLLPLTSDFETGSTLTSQIQICDIYSGCFSAGSAGLVYTCPGASYTFYGDTLNTAGTYYHTLTTTYGCDSLIALTLRIDTLPTVSFNFSNGTIPLGSGAIMLTGGTPTGGVYSGNGVNGIFFYPDSAGVGTHIISYTYTDSLGCSDWATAALQVVITGIEAQGAEHAVLFYPNPVRQILQLLSPKMNEAFTLSFFNVEGSLLKKVQLQNNQQTVDVSALPKGLYAVQITSPNKSLVKKLVIQ